MHLMRKHQYDNLKKHFKSNGVTPRVHGLNGKQPYRFVRLYSESTIGDVVGFLKTLAEKIAIPQPGRLPNYKDFSVMKLPSSETKRSVYERYKEAVIASGTECMGQRIFLKTWLKYCPYITILKPAQDLCDHCQQNTYVIQNSRNMSEDIKNKKLTEAMEDLTLAQTQ